MPNLPDVTHCRAKSFLGITEFAECLVPSPFSCRYSLVFGNSIFCHHPQLAEIIARTPQSPDSSSEAGAN
jgi:hypothetical protein